MTQNAVELNRVGKRFLVSQAKPSLFNNLFDVNSEEFWALRDVSLSIDEGEKVGIIGPNGAGKTTLLKIIAGITTPTTGKVKTSGKVVSLMNLEAGFQPDLRGAENIYLNGMLVGMGKNEIAKKYKQILRFADIGKFISMPFYTYSSGMKFRLAFSIAIASRCKILIIDEIFISGDVEFQIKTLDTIRNIQKDRKITTILCSHIPLFVWGFSDTFYELNKGRLKTISKTDVLKRISIQDKRWRKVMRHPLGKLSQKSQ